MRQVQDLHSEGKSEPSFSVLFSFLYTTFTGHLIVYDLCNLILITFVCFFKLQLSDTSFLQLIVSDQFPKLIKSNTLNQDQTVMFQKLLFIIFINKNNI